MRAGVPQQRPVPVQPFRDITVQLRCQPADDHRVLGIGLLAAEILLLARPTHRHRLDTYQRQLALLGQLRDDLPPVPGRLTRHRHPGKPVLLRPRQRPIQQRPQLPRLRPNPVEPADHLRIMIQQHRMLLHFRQIDSQNRVIKRNELPQSPHPRVAPLISRRQPSTLTHDVLLDLDAFGLHTRILSEEGVISADFKSRVLAHVAHIVLPTPY
jgi:hypothetical protein